MLVPNHEVSTAVVLKKMEKMQTQRIALLAYINTDNTDVNALQSTDRCVAVLLHLVHR